jgi:hypothetical protein
MKRFLLFFLLFCPALWAKSEMMTVSEVKARDVSYDSHEIRLTGDVFIDHKFGLIYCDKATFIMAQPSDGAPKPFQAEKIILEGKVKVELRDDSTLSADEAILDCEALEGRFKAVHPNKVVYVAMMQEEGKKTPVKTSSSQLYVKMKKEEGAAEYTIADLKGEGSVAIEYLPEKTKKEEEKTGTENNGK